jgi:3-hydroxyacyl-CoA dehydrogenase/3-hydroxy-2-methylbutyryl-CoA dehydrogenase
MIASGGGSSRIALITGGGSGLGRATVERFVRNNFAKVILCDLPSSDGYKIAKELNTNYDNYDNNNNNSCIFVPTDVTQSYQITNALDIGEEIFGSSRMNNIDYDHDHDNHNDDYYCDGIVNTVVNCAGIGHARKIISSKGVVHDLNSFENVLQINTIGTFNVIRLTVERMVKKKAIADNKAAKKEEAKAEVVVVDSTTTNTTEYGVIINTASIAAYDGQIGQVAYAGMSYCMSCNYLSLLLG